MNNLHYIAGFFDGEGYAGVAYYEKKRHLSVRVSLGNTYKPHVDALKKRWGGCVYRHKQYLTRYGKKPFWTWHLSGRAAIPFLRAMLPLVVIKKDAVDTALKAAESLGSPGPVPGKPRGSRRIDR